MMKRDLDAYADSMVGIEAPAHPPGLRLRTHGFMGLCNAHIHAF